MTLDPRAVQRYYAGQMKPGPRATSTQMYHVTQKNHYHYLNVSSCETKEPPGTWPQTMYEASLIVKCDGVGEDVEVGEDGDFGGEVDEVGGSDKVRQLL